MQYYKAGGSEGPALLMVHGFGVGGYHYDKNMNPLAAQYRVWAVDLLGQGEWVAGPGGRRQEQGLGGSTGSGFRHALRSEWPFIIIIITGSG